MKKQELKQETQTQELSIPAIRIATMEVKIVSVPNSTLLMNKMSDRVRKDLLDKVTGQTTEKRKIRDLDKEAEEKIHYDDEGNITISTDGFKRAMVEASPYLTGMNMKLVRGAVQFLGDFVPLTYKKKTINKSITRDAGRTKAPRETWRPEFEDWHCTLTIRYNSSQISPKQIVELLKLAGFHIGTGSWRPQCSGSHGQFTVANSK